MPLWLPSRPVILASKSDVRKKLLSNAGIPLEIQPASVDERVIERQNGPHRPDEAALILARAKALAISASTPGRIVVGADQTLALGDRRFYKPADRAEAVAQLRTLAGNTHSLHSGVAVARDGTILFEHVATAYLTMRPLSDDFIDIYLNAAGDAVLASVGTYQLEGAGIHLFDRVEGDYFTILGLPLVPLLDFMRRDGLMAK